MKKYSKIFLAMTIICVVFLVIFITVMIIKGISFDLNCKAYIKRAAEASNVEMAKEELSKAIDYAESNNLTEGIVSIFLKNPTNDIGFWYNNMKAAYQELENLPEETSALEKTNVLMKLRESLTDRDNGNTEVTHPTGISIYPNNVLYFWWGMASIIGICVFRNLSRNIN